MLPALVRGVEPRVFGGLLAEPDVLPARRLVGGALELMAGDKARAALAWAFFASVLVVGVSYRYCSATGDVVALVVAPVWTPAEDRW